MEIDWLELRLVWVVEGERAMVPLELRVRLLMGVLGVSPPETNVVEVDLVLVLVSVLLAGSSSWWSWAEFVELPVMVVDMVLHSACWS